MAVRKSIYSCILLALISFKVCSASIHISLHHNHDDTHEEHCELCEQALSILNEEFSNSAEVQVYEEANTKRFHLQTDHYESVYAAAFLNNTLLVRPPPTT